MTLSALPPVLLCRLYTEPSGAIRSTFRSPLYGWMMLIDTEALLGALPVRPDTVMVLVTPVALLSGML
ncbi:hypothetical protein D3C71_1978400 [compost metagenome]